MTFMSLNKVNVIRAIYIVGIMIVASISLGFGFISNEDTLSRPLENFKIILIGNKNECTTAYFTHV